MPPATIMERPVKNRGHSVAPRHSMAPFQRAGPSLGIKRVTHRRMNAVGADQDVAAGRGAVRAGAVEEIGGDAGSRPGGRRRGDGRYGCGVHRSARARRRESRPAAGRDGSKTAARRSRRRARAARARSPGRSDWCRTAHRSDRDCIEPLQKPEASELLDRMRQRIDADAELADLLGLLEHLAFDTARMQHQRGGEPADPAACDDYFHGLSEIRCRMPDIRLSYFRYLISDIPISGYSGSMPASRITSPQRCVSSLTKALASAGVPPPGPMLSSLKRSSRPGSCIAALAAALSWPTISGGVFGGAVSACQVSEMQP